MPDTALKIKFWQVGLADLERQLEAGRDGLSSAEAAARQLQYGANALEERRRVSLPLRFLSRFRNPLVLILLAAAAISALTSDLSSFIIIAAIVLTSAMLDTVQEYRAEAAAERLKTSVALKEQVVRDGREITVPGRDLVPGDVVLLAAGDLVPADGRLIEAKDFFVNEALLTGESYPSEKHASDEGVESAEVANATNAAFMGSSVMNGSARLLVCGIGHSTQLGEISSSLRTTAPPSALDLGTHKFGMLIVRFTEVLVLFVLLINLLFQRPWLDSFLFAVALAVGLTPELLPMIISVTLPAGIVMSKAQVIASGSAQLMTSAAWMSMHRQDRNANRSQDIPRPAGRALRRRERARARSRLAQQPLPGGLEEPARPAISKPAHGPAPITENRRGAFRLSAAPRFGARGAVGSSSHDHRGRAEDMIKCASQ